jgi:molybdate transport system ATP-binding protein
VIEIDITLPLERFDLRVQMRSDAEAIAVLGPSGCGKTSLLEVIAGLRRRAVGRLVLDGVTLLDSVAGVCLPPERRHIGYVPQDSALFPHLSVRANVRFALRPSPNADQRFHEATSILEIEPLLNRYPSHLSGGERQRVALARALVSAPRLLLLDEPFAAVDTELKERIFPYLLRVRDEAKIKAIYVTHNLGEATDFAGQALLLQEGRVQGFGPPAEVLNATVLSSLDSRAAFDNVLDGVIKNYSASAASLAVGELLLTVPNSPDLRSEMRAVYSVPAEDILLATHPLTGVSARNVLPARIVAFDSLERDLIVRVKARQIEWRVRITADAAADLALMPGKEVWIAIKTSSIRRLK